jgi:hypothetical protein
MLRRQRSFRVRNLGIATIWSTFERNVPTLAKQGSKESWNPYHPVDV